MVPNWLKMTKGRGESWRNSLYQSPVDPKLHRDKQRLDKMVQGLVSCQVREEEFSFQELEQSYALLSRIRLFLHLYLSLETNLRATLEQDALKMLEELNVNRIQLQALSYWAVSNVLDAPKSWKQMQRRKGVSAMPWRAAVTYSEQTHYASDLHWIEHYKYDQTLNAKAEGYGGLSQMAQGLRSAECKERENAAKQMGRWLEDMGSEGEELFRSQCRIAMKKQFNSASIDASQRTLEIARRVALKRGPELSAAFYGTFFEDKPVWHDRYTQSLKSDTDKDMPWRTCKASVQSVVSSLHPELGKVAGKLLMSGNLIQPKGRGGGFTTPVFYSSKGRAVAGPFIYAPFDGSAESCRTLVHEMGHGVHACLAAALGPMQSDMGWALAEAIALTCEQLQMNEQDFMFCDQEFSMLVHQPAIGMFEREVGAAKDEASLSAIWIDSLRAHYGETVSLEGYESFWRRHSTSLSATGYPMAYCLGWVLASHISRQIKSDRDGIQSDVLNMMRQGGKIGFDEAVGMMGVYDVEELIHQVYDRAINRLKDNYRTFDLSPTSTSSSIAAQ